MVRLISILATRLIRLISIHFIKFRIFTLISILFVKFRIFTPISLHFVILRIFTLISIRVMNLRKNTSISIHITRKLKIFLVHILWLLYHNYHTKNFHIRKKLFSWFLAYNFLKPHITGMHTGIQNLLLWEKNIHASLYKTFLDKLNTFIFQKRGFKALFSANHWAAICTICKDVAFWLAEKILLIHFVRINKLNVSAWYLPTKN